MVITSLFNRNSGFSDADVVSGMKARDSRCEEWFYSSAQNYFNKHFSQVFFDKDRKQEIFQTAFIKLWTEMTNGKIDVIDGKVCRMQTDGTYKAMVCNLNTFMMAFARTEFRELVRNIHEEYYENLYDNKTVVSLPAEDGEGSIKVLKERIVDECLQMLSPRCIEILTLFYYQGKSLDQIMEIRGEKNTSKNGLKTAKNKCMNRLNEEITSQFRKYNIKAK